MRTILVLSFGFLTACGFQTTNELHPAFNGSDESISAYRERFIEEARLLKNVDLGYSRTMPMNFGDLGYTDQAGGTVGYCLIYPSGEREIQVDRTFWASAYDEEKEQLIFHELGHCVLLRPHLTSMDASGLPESIMNPTLIWAGYYNTRKNHYLNELFSVGLLANSKLYSKIFYLPEVEVVRVTPAREFSCDADSE